MIVTFYTHSSKVEFIHKLVLFNFDNKQIHNSQDEEQFWRSESEAHIPT